MESSNNEKFKRQLGLMAIMAAMQSSIPSIGKESGNENFSERGHAHFGYNSRYAINKKKRNRRQRELRKETQRRMRKG